jgi:hypothetical protein
MPEKKRRTGSGGKRANAGRPRIGAVNPSVTIFDWQFEQMNALAANRGTNKSVIAKQVFALALPLLQRWQWYTGEASAGMEYAPDVMTEPEKYNATFSDEDLIAAGLNPAEFGEYFYSVLTEPFLQHRKGARVIIDAVRDIIAVEV